MSHQGSKSDIKRIDKEEEYVAYLSQLKEIGYRQCLVQEYIDYNYQYVIHGAILKNSGRMSYVLLRNEREWPTTGGTGSLRSFEYDERIETCALDIVKKIRDYGYRGLFDIEFFDRNGEVILNEVNFRSSGIGYSMFHQRVYYPCYYYLDAIGKEVEGLNVGHRSRCYAMNVLADFSHVRHRNLKITKWIKDLLRTRDFSLFDIRDLAPTWAFYRNLLLKKRR